MIMLVRDDHFVRDDTVIDPMEHSAQWTFSPPHSYKLTVVRRGNFRPWELNFHKADW